MQPQIGAYRLSAAPPMTSPLSVRRAPKANPFDASRLTNGAAPIKRARGCPRFELPQSSVLSSSGEAVSSSSGLGSSEVKRSALGVREARSWARDGPSSG
jgi:hypothetical protein